MQLEQTPDSPLLLPRRAAVLGGHQELGSFMPLLAISESELRQKAEGKRQEVTVVRASRSLFCYI
jgi:hypothetical protein